MRRDFACSAIDRASANARSPSLEPSVAITIVSNMSPPRCVALPTPTASAPTAKSTARKCRASRAEGPQRVGKATSTAEGPRRGGQGHVYEGLYPCLLYTSDAADEEDSVDVGGRRFIKKKTK